jgi:hypothetical protein
MIRISYDNMGRESANVCTNRIWKYYKLLVRRV